MPTKRCKYCGRPLTVADRLFGSGACVKCYEKYPKGRHQPKDGEASAEPTKGDSAQNPAFQHNEREYQIEPVQFPPDVLDALETLCLSKSASREEVMKRYKILVAQHQPDKVSNLGPEMIDIAKKKALQLSRAYELVVGFFDTASNR